MRSPREAGLSLIEMVGERDGLIGSAGSPQRARAPARAEASVGGLYNRHAELRSLPAKPLNRQGWPIRCLDRGEPIAVTGIDAIMNRRSSKPNLTARLVGHIFGVLGAMMGIDSIVTSVNPQFMRLFPFQASGIQQTSAGLISIGLIALGLWLVLEREGRSRGKIDPPGPR